MQFPLWLRAERNGHHTLNIEYATASRRRLIHPAHMNPPFRFYFDSAAECLSAWCCRRLRVRLASGARSRMGFRRVLCRPRYLPPLNVYQLGAADDCAYVWHRAESGCRSRMGFRRASYHPRSPVNDNKPSECTAVLQWVRISIQRFASHLPARSKIARADSSLPWQV
jgi:hypothetical protein